MTAGPRLAIAPRFHLRADWPGRVELPAAEGWRAATAAEIAAVVADPLAADAVLPPDRIGLFLLPPHLRDGWWRAAENLDDAAPAGEAYERFVRDVVDFCSFKQLPLPASCSFDVRVSRPDLASTRLDGAASTVVAWINLGDEDTHVVLARPRLRLRLGPGEGVWLHGADADGDTRGKSEIDVVLTLQRR